MLLLIFILVGNFRKKMCKSQNKDTSDLGDKTLEPIRPKLKVSYVYVHMILLSLHND